MRFTRTFSPPAPRFRRGLSFVELTIGMMITGLLMAALATFLTAVGAGWKQTATLDASRNTVTRGGQQLRGAMSGMLAIAQVKQGGVAGESAYVFLWKNDSYGGSADKKAQAGEMALLEYDPTAQAVYLYECKAEADMNNSQKSLASVSSWGDSTDPAVVSYFKTSSIIGSKKTVMGGGSGTNKTKVTSAKFSAFSPTGGRPMVLYDLAVENGGTTSKVVGNAVLRTNQTASNLTSNVN